MKETLYFSHDYNARNDPKLQRLMKRHGVAGIGAYWCIVEMLYEEGGRMRLSEVTMIAFALHVDRKLVVSLIRDFGLFQTGDGAFWSESVCSRLRMRRESAERRSLAGKKGMKSRWGDRPEESRETEENPKGDNNAITMLSDNDNNVITPLLHSYNNVTENDNNVMKNDNNVTENDNNVITMLLQGDDANSARKEKKSNQKKSKEENPKESGKEKVQPASRFVPPSIEEIQSYIDEKGYRMNAERFHAFYESKGWYVGKTKMKDWRAAVSGWALRDRERGKTAKNEKFSDTEWKQ